MNRRPKRVVVSAAILIPEYEALEAYARTQGTTTSSAIRECLRAAGVFETAVAGGSHRVAQKGKGDPARSP